MKKILTIISGLTLFSTNINSITILTKDDTNFDQKYYSPENFRGIYSKFVNIVRTIQEKTDYCGAAVVQSLFLTLGAPEQLFSQSDIYHALRMEDENPCERGVNISPWFIEYLNFSVSLFNPEFASRFTFSLIEYEENIGNPEQNALLFQNFIIENLNEGVPIIFNYFPINEELGHSVIIRGIQTAQDPLNTIYWYLDPMTGESNYCFDGRELFARNRFTWNAVGINANNFDFNSKQIKIKIDEEKFNKKLEMGTSETVSTQVDLTQEAGITSLSEIQEFKYVTLNDYSNQIAWKDKKEIFTKEIWQTKYFQMNDINWKVWSPQTINNEDLAYKTEYSSVLWNNYRGDLMLTLRYKYQLNAESGKNFDVKNAVTLGNIITLTF